MSQEHATPHEVAIQIRKLLVARGGTIPSGLDFDALAGGLIANVVRNRSRASLRSRVLELFRRSGGTVQITHAQIAEQLGTSRETVTRICAEIGAKPVFRSSGKRKFGVTQLSCSLLLLIVTLPASAESWTTTSPFTLRAAPASGTDATAVYEWRDEATGAVLVRASPEITVVAGPEQAPFRMSVRSRRFVGSEEVGPWSAVSKPIYPTRGAFGHDLDGSGEVDANDYRYLMKAFLADTKSCASGQCVPTGP